MKKIISIVLAVMLVVSVAAVSVGAVSYNPIDPETGLIGSYTVDANTPYAEEAIVACGGDLSETMTLYFQAPADWANKFNTFAGPDDSEPYMHVCIYWWGGIGKTWPDGTGVQWCGYQAHLIDKENRIYSARIPSDGGTPVVVWNNGVNGGMDKTKEIFNYARQILDLNTEGVEAGSSDTLPEGSSDEWTCDGLIAIIDYTHSEPNKLTGFDSYGSQWYAYYGKGCYGNYTTDSPNFHGRTASCVNPDHNHAKPGDVNNDKSVDINDVLCIQRYLANLPQPTGMSFDLDAADVDEDDFVSIMDATRIQRFLAQICNIDGSKPYVEPAE